MPLSAGPFSTSPAAGSVRSRAHGPTNTRIAPFGDPLATFTPSASSAPLTVPQAAPPPSHSTTVTGSCPSHPVVNGAGHEPTTAGTCSLADQLWLSHQIFSPPSSDTSAA